MEVPRGVIEFGLKLAVGRMQMLMELDVAEGGNSPLAVNRFFDLLDQPRDITGVFTSGLDGEDRWCRVTGWSLSGPCPARAARSEDSGEGVVLLVYGGGEGIRLQPWDSTDEWDLDNVTQWGEACLMLDKDSPVEYWEPGTPR